LIVRCKGVATHKYYPWIEVRSTNAQSLLPPSLHDKGGDLYAFEEPRLPILEVTKEAVQTSIMYIAVVAEVVQQWDKGSKDRQDKALALGGVWARLGWSVDDVSKVITAITTIAGDEEAAKRNHACLDTLAKYQKGEKITGWSKVEKLFGKETADTLRRWSKIAALDDETNSGGKSQVTRLIEYAQSGELWHDAENKGYATLTVDGHKETWRTRSSGFRSWLCWQAHKMTGRGANASAVQDALLTIDALARYEGVLATPYLRAATFDDVSYIDLCDSTWRAIKVTADGWEIVAQPPVRFIRGEIMQPLPEPVAGDIDTLFKYINVKEEERCLVLGWLVTTMRSKGPYPALALQGEQGTAKSTATRVLRTLVDPSVVELRAAQSRRLNVPSAQQCGYRTRQLIVYAALAIGRVVWDFYG